jgi:hypothetical protein
MRGIGWSLSRRLLWLGCLLAAAAFVEPAHALRCGGRVIETGSSKAEVLHHCGEPTWVEKRPEKRVERDCVAGREHRRRNPGGHRHFRRDGRGRSYDACVHYVDVEEWFYNFGPSRFTQTLIFENNRLLEIIDGDYGY